MKNRKILYLLITVLLIAFFGTSYSLTCYINKKNLKLEACDTLPYLKLTSKNIINDENINLKQTSVTSNLVKVTENTKFVFKIKYKDKEVRNMVLEKHFNGSSILNSKTVAELDEFFKNQGYIVQNMSNNEIVFVNSSDRYSYKANSYYLGVFVDLVTIYRTDQNGDIAAHKLFNLNLDAVDGKSQKYNFEVQDKGELQYIKLDDLKDKDGLVDDLIRGKKHSINSNGSDGWEFETTQEVFDYAMGLLKS